jgi:hypothetical protein
MKLFLSQSNSTNWFAFGSRTGWVKFPAERDGWERRQPAGRGAVPSDIREVPIHLGFNTGIPGAEYLGADCERRVRTRVG